jgi:hypothetical protein
MRADSADVVTPERALNPGEVGEGSPAACGPLLGRFADRIGILLLLARLRAELRLRSMTLKHPLHRLIADGAMQVRD